MSYRITDQAGLEVAPATEIALNRELTYSDQNTLAKESEENMLYRDMQNDAIQQLVRRLQILRPTTIAPTKSPS
jgi:LPS-assembly lipoprotein